MTDSSLRRAAADEAASIHRIARMIFELEETPAIVDAWKRFARGRRAGHPNRAAADAELVSALLAVFDASRRMAAAHVAGAASALAESLEVLTRDLEDSTKDLEAEDRLGNFEIQDLMSNYNQAETLASTVLKKRDDAAAGIIGKI